MAIEKRRIESHDPTQAKGRLEWGTRHLLPVWQDYGRSLNSPGAAGYHADSLSPLVTHDDNS
jgi:hypothetical protein